MRLEYMLIPVTELSLENMEDNGHELSGGEKDIEDFYSEEQKNYYLTCLTKRQREVVNLMSEDRKRPEIAATLHVSLQAINQIIPRIRLRLIKKCGLKKYERSKQ